LEENFYVLSWDQNKKYRLEPEDISVIAAMIDSKIPINTLDFEANKKKDQKQILMKTFPSENSEFPKREEVFK